MYWPENVSLFGTHVAVTDHRCCGSIALVMYAADGTLTDTLGISPTASRYVAKHKLLYMGRRYCDTDYHLRTLFDMSHRYCFALPLLPSRLVIWTPSPHKAPQHLHSFRDYG